MQLRNILEIIFYKSFTDIKAEAARSYLGLLWWIIEPIFYLFTFYVLFVLVLKRGGPDFVPNFLCGIIVWKWFVSAINGGVNAISSHRGLVQQVYVPKYIFPIIAVLGSTVRFLPVFTIFTIFLLLYGIPAQITWLAAPVLMFIQLMYGA
jgi:lipopolysaccharide transport system permease protein